VCADDSIAASFLRRKESCIRTLEQIPNGHVRRECTVGGNADADLDGMFAQGCGGDSYGPAHGKPGDSGKFERNGGGGKSCSDFGQVAEAPHALNFIFKKMSQPRRTK